MRAFLAIELPDATRAAVAALQQRLQSTGVRASWTKPENFHLTLRFLGNIEEGQLQRLQENLEKPLRGLGPLTLCFEGAGAFPNLRRPGVLWAGLRVLEGKLEPLHGVLEAAARIAGLPADNKPFHPHVTVGRVRDPRRIPGLSEELARCATLGGDAFPVNAVALFESRLSAGGSLYRRLQLFSLT